MKFFSEVPVSKNIPMNQCLSVCKANGMQLSRVESCREEMLKCSQCDFLPLFYLPKPLKIEAR